MSTHVREPIGFSVLVQKPETFLRKLMWSVHHWHSFYKLSATHVRLAIELGRWRGIVGLKRSILLTGKVMQDRRQLLERSTDQIDKEQLTT